MLALLIQIMLLTLSLARGTCTFFRNSTSLLGRQDFNELLQYTGGDYSSIASLQKELVKYESFPISVPRSSAGTRKTFNYK